MGLSRLLHTITQQADRWGYPREYTERRLQELQSDCRAEKDCANKSKEYSVWLQYGDASRIVLDNSTLFLSKNGNDSLFMTPTRPASFLGLRPSCFLPVFPNSLLIVCAGKAVRLFLFRPLLFLFSSSALSPSFVSLRTDEMPEMFRAGNAGGHRRGTTTVHELVARVQHSPATPAE